MRLDTSQQMRLQQKLILAPRMIQSMEILQLPIMQLQERIQQELQENPVLELSETTNDETAVAEEPEEKPTAKDEVEQELVIDESGDLAEDFDRMELLNRDWEDHFNESH